MVTDDPNYEPTYEEHPLGRVRREAREFNDTFIPRLEAIRATLLSTHLQRDDLAQVAMKELIVLTELLIEGKQKGVF